MKTAPSHLLALVNLESEEPWQPLALAVLKGLCHVIPGPQDPRHHRVCECERTQLCDCLSCCPLWPAEEWRQQTPPWFGIRLTRTLLLTPVEECPAGAPTEHRPQLGLLVLLSSSTSVPAWPLPSASFLLPLLSARAVHALPLPSASAIPVSGPLRATPGASVPSWAFVGRQIAHPTENPKSMNSCSCRLMSCLLSL